MSKLQVLYASQAVTEYMASVHPDDKFSGTLVRLWDHPKQHRSAMLVLPTMPDFTQDLVIDSLPTIGQVHVAPTYVQLDTGTDRNSMFLTQDDDMVRVSEPSHAIAIAMHLLAWAYAEQQPKTKQEEV